MAPPFEEVLDEARRNLEAASRGPWSEVAPGVLQAPDANAAARACLPALMHGLPVRGEVVGLVLAPSVFVVTGSEDPRGLLLIAEYAMRVAAERADALPAFMVRHDGAGWVEHRLPWDHPAAVAVAVLRRDWLVRLYGAQASPLQAAVGGDLHVSVIVPTNGPRVPSTLAPLGLGFASLVPVADYFVVNRVLGPGRVETLASVARGDAERILGLYEEPAVMPRRFRFDGQASADQLGALVAADLPRSEG